MRHPELGAHQALKIPHHGSAEAFHIGLMLAGNGANWIITPFDPARLPRAFDSEGLPRLIEQNGRVAITQLMAACTVAGGGGPRVPLSAIVKRTQREPTGDPFADQSTDLRSAPAASALDLSGESHSTIRGNVKVSGTVRER